MDVAVDTYIDVKKVHQDTPFTSEIYSVTKNSNSVRGVEYRQAANITS